MTRRNPWCQLTTNGKERIVLLCDGKKVPVQVAKGGLCEAVLERLENAGIKRVYG